MHPSCLTLAGLVVLRPLMASRSIAFIIVLLTLAAGVLALPNIGLYYGVQEWTAARTSGVVVAREVRDRQTGAVEVSADYSNLGTLLIVVALIALAAPLMAVLAVQASRFRTSD